jgi:ribonucleoside-diphosphate reductase alpha chain
MSKELDELKLAGFAPLWLTDEGFKTLSGGYLLPDETPFSMYVRVSNAMAKSLNRPDLQEDFFEIIWNNWLCLATPVAANLGTDRGLPISCNSIHVGDSVDSIFGKAHELAMLSKNGAGVGIYLGDVRGRGALIKGNGRSEGVIPWAKVYDTTCVSVSQGSTRRGAGAAYLDINHPDIEEFINIRRPTGDVNRRCMNLHHAVCIDDEFMKRLESGEEKARHLWTEIIKSRF